MLIVEVIFDVFVSHMMTEYVEALLPLSCLVPERGDVLV